MFIDTLQTTDEINEAIHAQIFHNVGETKPYATDPIAALFLAEKVKLFEHIIFVKNGNDTNSTYDVFHRGLNVAGEHKTSIDFIDNQFLVSCSSFCEMICRASLLLYGRANEKTIATDQSGATGFTKTG